MKRLRLLWRLLTINKVLVRHGIDSLALEFIDSWWLYSFVKFNPRHWFAKPTGTRAERLRRAFEDLGPICVKFGQILSTRRDLLPDDIALELAKLQDQVPAFPGEQAKAILELAYGKSIEAMFQQFSVEPLASASIAQVHQATLNDGADVVIKVLRPGINKQIQRDIEVLYVVAGLVEHYWAHGKRLRPREVVAEFERHIFDELDLVREAANASQLRRNFPHDPKIYVPEVYWDYTRENVMVMERIQGVPISDMSTLIEKQVNLKKLAEYGVEIFFTQVFRDCFFHADMHPGNVFVDITDPENPRYMAIDFGIMGTLGPEDQRYLAENFLAFFKRDYRRVAVLHVESGWVPSDTRVDEFESAIRTVCEPIFEKPLRDISCGKLLLRLFQTAGRFNMEIQPQLLMLQKTLLNIEGLGRQLYPDLDLWSTAKPFLEQWLRKQVGARAFVRKVWRQAPIWAEKLPDMPDLVHRLLVQAEHEKVVTSCSMVDKAAQTNVVKKRKRVFGYLPVLGSMLLLAAGVHWLLETQRLQAWWHSAWSSITIGAIGVGVLLLSQLPRSDRET